MELRWIFRRVEKDGTVQMKKILQVEKRLWITPKDESSHYVYQWFDVPVEEEDEKRD